MRVVLTLVAVLTLVGCAAATPTADPSVTATSSPSAPEDPSPTPTETETETASTPSLPAGFPEPATLVGQDLVESRVDEVWTTVVGGEPLDLRPLGGECTGPTDDVCATSVALFTAPGEGDVPAPSTAGMILLLASTGELADGTPTWQVLDGLVTTTPDGEPALLELCDGTPGAVIYPAPGAGTGPSIPVAAAWGIDAAGTALVELDPASVTCAYLVD